MGDLTIMPEHSPMEVENEGSSAKKDEILTDVDNDNVVDASIKLKEKDRPEIAPKGIHFIVIG